MSKRITFVVDELLGYSGNGIGTTTAFLGAALSRLGHHVEILYLGAVPAGPVEPEWQQLYESFSIEVRPIERSGDAVEPGLFAQMRDVAVALGERPPDVVIAQDLGGPVYVALRLRRLGLAFASTSFVVRAHGTRQWIADASRKVRVLPGALEVSLFERACVELADVIVSPSAYMVDWMRRQGWSLPERTLVIPHPPRSQATGVGFEIEPIERRDRVERLAFFGRIEERKGVRPFVAALNELEPELLSTIELEFLGRAPEPWSPERVAGMLSERAKGSLQKLSFETELDQHEALARLSRPGTLVVMPSLEDNSPNAVAECLEHGIPFIASAVGGAPELVAEADRPRVLFSPDPASVEDALRRALSDGSDALRPARPAPAREESVRRWAEVVDLEPPAIADVRGQPSVDVVVIHRGSAEALARCLGALERQTSRPRVVVVLAGPHAVPREGLDRRAVVVRSRAASVEAARDAALPELEGEWVCFLDEEDVPEPALVETLVKAQAASGADVVSCGLLLERDGERPLLRFFPGQPRGLGVLGNGYGTVCLLRRSLLDPQPDTRPAEGDPDWVLLARLSAAGADIVSVPLPLVTRRARPGTIEGDPGDALLVLESLEGTVPEQTAAIARLAAGLAADRGRSAPAYPAGLARRAFRRLKARLR